MAASTSQANTLNDYNYMNEDSIDSELKCSLCIQPFQIPVSATCGHTFCQACINPWIARQATCPTCRIRTSTEEFRPISTRIVLNQLERLLVRCKRCNETNIQRGNINEHEKRCPNQTVSCPAFNIKCAWKGPRSELAEHTQECPFQKIRPAIDDIYEHLRNIYEPLVDELQTLRQQLEKQTQRSNEQTRFLLTVFNKGKPMSDRCIDNNRYCQLRNWNMNPRNQMNVRNQRNPRDEMNVMTQTMKQMMEFQNSRQNSGRLEEEFERNFPTDNLFCCTNCQARVNPNDILLHHCQGGGVCRSYVEQYGNVDSY